jgi:hypothetical protein
MYYDKVMGQPGKALVITICVVLAVAGAIFAFLSRPPVLVVTDEPFTAIYGSRRILLRQIRSSLLLLRPVRPVMIAEGAGPDLLVFAVEEAASRRFARRPYCVLVPRRYADGARRYGRQFPEIPVALLMGRAGPGDVDGDFFMFRTDLEQDLYRAGRCAAVLGGETGGDILVFPDRAAAWTAEWDAGRNAFVRGLREEGNGKTPRFLDAVPETAALSNIACVVLAGSGGEYFDRNLRFPVILFTWLDPALISRQVAVVFDDSAWAQVVPAVRMIAANRREARIPSDLLIISAKNADKDMSKRLKKTARAEGRGKGPEEPVDTTLTKNRQGNIIVGKTY